MDSVQQGSSYQPLFQFTQEMYQGILETIQPSKTNSQPKAYFVTISPIVLNTPSSNDIESWIILTQFWELLTRKEMILMTNWLC